MSDRYRCHGVTRSGERCQRRSDNKGFCVMHPTKGGKVTKTGFALITGVDKSMVSKWIAAGTIEADENGHIEWEAAELAIAEARSFAHALQRQGEPHEESRFADGEEPGDLDPDEVRRRYSIAQMREKEESARREEIKRREDEGRLVDIEAVREDALDAAERLKARLMTIPDHLSPRLATIGDIRTIHAEITAELNKALRELSAEFLAEGGQ